ncbi:MAG: hypothetical protein COU42_02525 [Candidatus Nealsonbacteria bacterium CG10_big_fil_rev_8_21_14_0_10_36_24]|uniref:Uncharacterized protein n=2 Tax=Candidatus Nealsoniibacteriota TaxID=1817911 RepID=A0A2H0YNH4_9BACT|nr:MAG: hypothetical protein COU42_02525 [Candidatus Nealsonbacteria bacterium CG10_big_fil_rev_8_21_14_0_10_36_24]PIS40057.1 MAG: hypothetical protein COT32_01815 [Candidatus Nealsonbacteria bacterium CG08_land_8_20_14_0_20_36_22]
MDFLKKIQNQPERIRKMILWITVVVVALILASWWIYNSYWNLKNFKEEEFIKELELPKFTP